MKKIIINENQLQYLTEALGVPDFILEGAELLYQKVVKDLKTIKDKREEYSFSGKINMEIGGKKKIKIDSYELGVQTEEIEGEDGVLDIVQMGMGGRFGFDRDTLMKKNEPSTKLELTIVFAVGEDWDPKDLLKKLEEEKEEHISSLAHEIKHKYDKQVKLTGLIGPDADYQASVNRSTFGIPAIDRIFYRYFYYIHAIENLVRPVEVASSIKSKNLTKSQFRDFVENNRVFKELKEIKNYTFQNFIEDLKNQEERLDKLIEHVNRDPSNMTIDQKIKMVAEIVYVDLVNNKMDLFVKMTEHQKDDFLRFGSQLGFLPPQAIDAVKKLEQTDDVRRKFLNFSKRFQNNPIKFFEVEFDNFNYIANKMYKKLTKLYSMAKDDEQVSESILNWDLHQQIMEKKYGKRKIETKYKNWNLK